MLIYILLNARKHGTLKGQLSNLKTITIHTNHTHTHTERYTHTQLTLMSYLRCFVSILGFFRHPFCCWFSLKNNDNGERNCNNSCKTFCTILLGCISGGNSYPTIPFMVVPALHPFLVLLVFVLELNPWDPYASCSLGCGLQIFLFFVGFTVEAEFTFSAPAEGRGGVWQCGMRCRFNTFAVRFYSPTAIKQFLSALKCVYMWLGVVQAGGKAKGAQRSICFCLPLRFCLFFTIFFASFTRLHKKFINFFCCYFFLLLLLLLLICCVWRRVAAPAIKLRPCFFFVFYIFRLCVFYAHILRHMAVASSFPSLALRLNDFFFTFVLLLLPFFGHIPHTKYATEHTKSALYTHTCTHSMQFRFRKHNSKSNSDWNWSCNWKNCRDNSRSEYRDGKCTACADKRDCPLSAL